ncbi:MAG: [Fe-Fe] hydrogenase large subunit C-terminal domain-containing protein [Pirellulaceae bacterium]
MAAAFINTIPERCRVCYTCVRECPAKAIRIENGQAGIVAERCIACGNCVKVCAKHAKQAVSSIPQVRELLQSSAHVAACIAPSFPAEFTEIDYPHLVGSIRALGFRSVHEVAFGADLVAAAYRKLLANSNGHQYISSSCPAIVGYVERYHPDLVGCLAPIVSPMVALARYLRTQQRDLKIVFIGPCIAKKNEADDEHLRHEIDAVLTFRELRDLLESPGAVLTPVTPSDFDPPYGASGALYPISRGALQAAGFREDLMTGEIISTQGRNHVREVIQEFADRNLRVKLLEVLCCEGCIMGAGMTSEQPLFFRRRRVAEYVSQRMAALSSGTWKRQLAAGGTIALDRAFSARDQRISQPPEEALQQILAKLGKPVPEDELNCGACGYETCREHAIAIHLGLAEDEMCLPYTIDRLSQACRELEDSHEQLASAQEALMQSEKLASMGQLAAGIAHEVNNPLGVVLMYAHLLMDDFPKGDQRFDDIRMIAEQADRCKNIVGGLLHFARQNKVVKYATDIVALVHNVVSPLRIPEGVQIGIESSLSDRVAEVDKDQIAQVLTNLINNALAATQSPASIMIRCTGDETNVRICVSDTGTGIPKENLKKIFEPFFTTKQPGKGTGLGLSVSYGIIKMHCGDILVESNADPNNGPTGTTFTVRLPRC